MTRAHKTCEGESPLTGCKRCGNTKTIKAHLISKAFCLKVQIGKQHAANVRSDGTFFSTQSGIYDTSIHCQSCDGKLSADESFALELCRTLRTSAMLRDYGRIDTHEFDRIALMRFCAGVLWKYSVTTVGNGQIDLFGHQNAVRDFAFRDSTRPEWFDVAICRPREDAIDNKVFAYRAPYYAWKGGVRFYRFFLGGILFNVRASHGKPTGAGLDDCWLSQWDRPRLLILPARYLEEYHLAHQLLSCPPVAKYIDKASRVGGG